MEFFETPEFWSATAFFLVVLVVVGPASRALESWGKRRAETVQSRFDEAQKLVDQAKQLKEQYQVSYAGRNAERQKLMREADVEIRFLETELLGQSADQMRRKTQEVEMRLKMIAEHGRQDVKRKMLKKVVQKTEKLFKKKPKENLNASVGRLIGALDTLNTGD